MTDLISIRNAKEHNLHNINIDLPKNKLIVITGVSGSGKSSLAFDTIYAEGQRRYVESLSSYARQFLDSCTRPEVESITGLSPTIAISQKLLSKNSRSTVSTTTGIYDYLRIMYSKIGTPYSPITGLPITKQSLSQIVETILKLPIGTKISILGILIRGKRGEHNKEIYEIKKQHYKLLKIDGITYDINNIPQLDRNKKHDIHVIINQISVLENSIDNITENIKTALKIGNGITHIEILDLPQEYKSDTYYKNQVLVFSENFACPETEFSIEEVEPRLFSFNTSYGSCKICSGIGKKYSVDKNLVIKNDNLSISEGAIHPIGPIDIKTINYKINSQFSYHYSNIILSLAKHYSFDLTTPWKKLDDNIKDIILFGSKEVQIPTHYQHEGYKYSRNKPFEGIINILNNKEDIVIEKLAEQYSSINICNECQGFRLRQEALSVKIDNKHIGELTRLSVIDAISWCKALPSRLNDQQKHISHKILDEIIKRLIFLKNVGLGYLTLDRESGTLSGGESQRIKLASQIGSGLTGIIYVLDEPSIGLHQRDNTLLINTLKTLRDIGNTVIVVEHDEETITNADYVVDIGPGAGQNGGYVIASGTPKEIMDNHNSITGQYLSNKKIIPNFKKHRTFYKWIEIIGAHVNNLQNIDVKIPLHAFTCITGVSGSGKSSLINNTLYQHATDQLNNINCIYSKCTSISGLEHIDKVIKIDQSPIGRTPLSNSATYTGLFTHIRSWFAELPLSKERGYTISRFSFNSKGGRCEACKGDGQVKIEMHFLPDVYVKCEQCKGSRYNKETLEVTHQGKSIADILDMTVDQAYEFFIHLPLIKEKLDALRSVGMGYIKIGQTSNTLSGGEAQRIKLSKELSKRSTGKTLYILDEPTTGLHFADIDNLLHVLHKLRDLGNTIVVIEHNLHVIKTAEYIIDIGPNGGDDGGQVVATGTPEEIVQNPHSITGQYLKPYLNAQS
ncbi:excinuclease ABC subunit A [Ehrlichia chaffeensis str. Heartland]|uniref:UvrABC system protein A n=1 Tax=Ehrlichia chaffeensis (strain ATCC CRL-10679 / Arkansas) TaxID=205920 RepID=Q2GG50_EHRCR|nr:excinuclease ABC subunit UvrA [Ehrlichia chaffeensis]ABD44886.1 excinuclease ABC, A subunit [Ehrlichia chaffeensis str. Arkansas]AHX03842.1 excinuclease ABC subunit A [Ehrlichia chaffeensis str. Heartland]AHX05432.1 excinuclease ABC subunit A [Ehrlichia chaffeensis str. Jax]AHX06420.1 excinuclease ABC subunit A [Ehrlichia chaffeensis str. Liberty]AHX08522.1 excinuclease ABC subunit A [Ehrlichia chaffeensis str. Saint Vincent]